MALVKCPECGREGCSDSAKTCPACGYEIKEHFNRIEKEKQQQMIYELRMTNVKEPEKPKDNIYGMIVCGVLAIIALFTQMDELGLVGCGIMLIGAFVFYNQHVETMKKYTNDCELYRKDKKAYQRQEVQNEDFRKVIESSKPRCPHCNSTNIERISTISRGVSVAIAGLASGKIGKQYRCKKCKHGTVPKFV